MKIDLHTHSTCSDGNLSPSDLIDFFVKMDINIASLTDHDSTEGLNEAYEKLGTLDTHLELIPGIEISAVHPLVRNSEVHVLGYFMHYNDPVFQQTLTYFRGQRELRCKKIIGRLNELGYQLSWDDLKPTGSSIGRPHIAKALFEKGYLRTPKDAFKGLLNEGGSAFVNQENISMQGAVDLIRSVSGVAVLAHPVYVKNYDAILPTLQEMGFSGFEVFYPEFTLHEQKQLLKRAHQLNLLPCGGSDYHATGISGENLPGTGGPSQDIFNELRRRAKASNE